MRKTRLPLLALLALVAALAAPAAAQPIADDCNYESKVELPSLSELPFVRIRIRFPLPFRLAASIYFDGIIARQLPDGRWRVIKYLGNKVVDRTFLGGSELTAALDDYCPGLADKLPVSGVATSQQSDARFAASIPASGQASQYFAMADFDGDGNDDIAETDGTLVTVSLLTSTASVRSSTRYGAGPSLAFAVTGDFNGDGRVDLVVSSDGSATNGTTSILLGSGGGLFQPAQVIVSGTNPSGAKPSAVAAADFNGDGKLDLAVTSASSVIVLMGNGNGTFQPLVTYAAGGTSPGSMVVDDFDADGNLDIVLLNVSSNNISMLRGNPGGTFKPAVVSTGAPATSSYSAGYIAYSDLNHDGKLDLVVRYASKDIVSLFLGKGDGSFQTSRDYVAPDNSSSLAIVPLKDGKFLFFMRDRVTKDTIIMIAPGDGTLSATPAAFVGSSLTGIAAGDVNGDIRPDIVVADRNNSRLAVLINTGTDSFASPAYSPLPSPALGVAVGDLNGDGRSDVVTALTNGTVGVQLGTAGGALGAVASFAAGTRPTKPRLIDLNRDGKLDLVVVSESYYLSADASLSVLLGNGDGTFQSASTRRTAAASFSVGDFNNDQKLDLAVTVAPSQFGIFEPHNVAIFLGRGDGTFLDPILTPVVSSNGIAAGDFNGDGKLDIVIGQPTGSSTFLALLLGNGNGTFRPALGVTAYNGGQDLQASDLNGDGFLDLLNTSCCGDSDSTYLLGNGDGSFQEEVDLLSGDDPIAAVLADFNGDAKPDVAFASQSTGTVVAFSLGFQSLVVTSAATPLYRIAPDSIASAFGPALVKGTVLTGTKVAVKDSRGISRNATIFFTSQRQINFAIPAGTALGTSQVTVTAPDGNSVTTLVRTEAVAPALFALNAAGLVAANVVRAAGGVTTYEDIFQVSGGAVIARPIDLGPASDQVFLVLYGTGLRAAGTAGVTVTIGGISVPVSYAGPQGQVEGFDQVNVPVPRSLAGKGSVDVILKASGAAANTVKLTVK